MEYSISLKGLLGEGLLKKILEFQVIFINQLMYILMLVKLFKSPQQVCNAESLVSFFPGGLYDSPHTRCICPGISSASVRYIVSPYLQQIVCLQASSYTDHLTPVLKAVISFAALLSSSL